MSEQKTVKLEIEIPTIPENKIPEGMKRGTPAYEKRRVHKGDTVLNAEMQWEKTGNLIGHFGVVANFVPREPEEPSFIDRKVESPYDMYVIVLPEDRRCLSDISSHIDFVEYLWKDANNEEIYKSSQHFRTEKRGICTHVRFINPKYKKGE